MQVQFGVETVRGRAAGMRLLGEEVVDYAAVGLLQVADRLAKQRRGLQQQSLAAVVGLAKVLAALRGGRDIADRQVLECHEAFFVAEQPEIQELANLLMLQGALLNRVGQKRLVVFALHGILS